MQALSWRARLLSGAAALVAVTMLTACSPAPEPMVALGMRSGSPVVVFVACNSSLAIMNVYENDPARRPTVDPSSEPPAPPIWRIRSTSPQVVTEITLFEPPPDWEVTESTLTGLQPDVHYTIGGLSLRHAIPVDFTAKDLETLDSEHVLGADRRRTKVMTRAAFESAATGACPH